MSVEAVARRGAVARCFSPLAHLQEVDPGQRADKETHSGLQDKRARNDGPRGNHGSHFPFAEQAEDLRTAARRWSRSGGRRPIGDAALTSRSFAIPGVSNSQCESFSSLEVGALGPFSASSFPAATFIG